MAMPRLHLLRSAKTALGRTPPKARRVQAAPIPASDPDYNLSDTQYYRRLTGGGTRDLSGTDRAQMVSRGINFSQTHPLAARATSAMVEWTELGEFKVEAGSPEVQEVCDEVLADPRNDWVRVLAESMPVAMAAGVLFYPARANPFTGVPWFDWIDPEQIVGAEYAPDSCRVVEWYEWAQPGTTKPERLRNITAVRNPTHPQFGRLMGVEPSKAGDGFAGVLAFRFNSLPGMAFGVSDFWAGMDAWGRHEDILDRAGERAQVLASYMGDVKIDGSAQDVDTWTEQNRETIPRHATLLPHNEGVEYNLQPPPVGDGSLIDVERILRLFGSAATGIPPHLLIGDFESGTRAVATAANDPAYLRAKRKQAEMLEIVRVACVYGVDSVALVNPARFGSLPPLQSAEGRKAWSVKVRGQKLLKADPASGAPVLVSVTQALVQAMAATLIDVEHARVIFAQALTAIGVEEMDPTEIAEAVGREAAQQGIDSPEGLADAAQEMAAPEAA